ncbi:MAG: MmgE/PrpD family protein [Victivallaceae bacterium]|nr:MmgE/PrpD family protein [Victivallaceae bacterium]
MTIARKLTKIGLDVSGDEIPDSSYNAAIKLLLDALGCAIAGYATPGISGLNEQICEWGGKEEASLFLSRKKVPLPNAAFVNGAMIHALDFDDVYVPGNSLHLSSTLVPVVLGIAEKTGASGKDMLAALIIGIEISGQLGIAERDRRRSGAFLPSSLLNGFGAIISAARMFKMSAEECINALGINYAQIAGNRQALLDMTLTKRLQPAFAGRSAIWAVELAKRGITGSERIFEGDAGYCQAYLNGDNFNLEDFSLDLNKLQVENVSIKRYPSCGACHNVQIAAERLIKEEKLTPDEIERVEIFNCGPGGLAGHPFSPGRNPQVDAQFSVIWAVAHTLVRGPATLADYSNDRIANDQEVIAFCPKITFSNAPDNLPSKPPLPPDFPKGYLAYQGLIIYTKDGRRLQRAQSPAQTFAVPKDSFEQTVLKFKQCVEFSGLEDKICTDTIINTINDLRSEKSIITLIRQLQICC